MAPRKRNTFSANTNESIKKKSITNKYNPPIADNPKYKFALAYGTPRYEKKLNHQGFEEIKSPTTVILIHNYL